jgi:hypothetical protein
LVKLNYVVLVSTARADYCVYPLAVYPLV